MKNKRAIPVKIFVLVWCCAFISSSCIKTTILDRNYLIFGKANNACEGDCVHFLLLEDNGIYRDHINNMNSKIGNVMLRTPLTFDSHKLSKEKFELGNWLLLNFPNYLMENPGKNFGIPNGQDQGAIYIELKQKGKKAIQWWIDPDAAPSEIQNYIKQMEEIIQKVYF